ncbi:hypothetical protein TNCT_359421 [Trichonephila clavata]|uniref:Uncharacterized protein n=1 Tax=Trichonephila clavata TaxID=2740835 RepID=A0A8X6J5A5_TRICU|nr:hypothetical protein TNCT_359421 [Trichonephila clavata]
MQRTGSGLRNFSRSTGRGRCLVRALVTGAKPSGEVEWVRGSCGSRERIELVLKGRASGGENEWFWTSKFFEVHRKRALAHAGPGDGSPAVGRGEELGVNRSLKRDLARAEQEVARRGFGLVKFSRSVGEEWCCVSFVPVFHRTLK